MGEDENHTRYNTGVNAFVIRCMRNIPSHFTEYFAKKYEKKANEYWSSEREKGVSAYSRGQLMTSDASKTPLRMRSLNEERIVQPDKTVATLLIGIKVKRETNWVLAGYARMYDSYNGVICFLGQ